jgi:integrase
MKYRGQNDFGAVSAEDAGFAVQAAEEALQEEKNRRREERARKYTGTHTTMPIENREMQRKWLKAAKEHDMNRVRGGVSWYMLVLLGFKTGLRIGDLCRLKVADVRGRERVSIVAQKTGKVTDVALQDSARKAIDAALKGRDGNDWVLESRQRRRGKGDRKPISRQRCYGIMKEIAKMTGFQEHVGCHTMRKTFAWNYYTTCGNINELQKVLNHSSQEATIHYLGLDRKKIDRTIHDMPDDV